MRIWHQSFTDLNEFPLYGETLQSHADAVLGRDVSVVVHGLRPGTYPPATAPMDMNSKAGLRIFNAQQVCEAAVAAQEAGYDAFALGCFFDPGLHEARALVDIPVVSLTETCVLTACSLGRKFAVISLTDFQKMLTEDLVSQYGVSSRLAGVVAMTPAVKLYELEGSGAVIDSIKQRFVASCQEALRLGAEVIIPGDGVLNEFLVRHKMLSVDGAVIMDALGTLFHHAAFFSRGRVAGCFDVSRRLLYAKPTGAMFDHVRTSTGAFSGGEAQFSGGALSGRG